MDNYKNNILNIKKLFFIFLGIPFLGYIFYTGNHGNFYSYYLTGYYLPVILSFSVLLVYLSKFFVGKIIVLIILFVFLVSNMKSTFYKFNNPDQIILANQIKAVNWIKNDSINEKFNIDVYVPPVIPHSYNYLFQWLNVKQNENNVKLLYTLYEIDPPHPERLTAWLDRQDKIAKVIKFVKFGGITVERRERI